MIRLEFLMEPYGKGRPRAWTVGSGRGGYTKLVTPTRTRAKEDEIARLARFQYHAHPVSGPIALRIFFEMTRPKRPERTYPSKQDVDNCAKLVMDALNEIVWVDDVQIVRLSAEKKYGTRGRIVVEVEELAEATTGRVDAPDDEVF